MRDLKIHIIEQQASKWDKLGRALGLEDDQITNISEALKDNPNKSVTCCIRMIELWLRKIPYPTWDKLDDAIKTTTLPTSPTSTNKGGNHGYFYNVNINIRVDKTYMNVDM